MQVYITSAPVIGGQVEDRIHALYGEPCDARLAQIGLQEIHGTVSEMSANILEAAAAQVVHDAHRAPRSTRRSAMLDPMKDAPPVINTGRPDQ